MAMTNIQKYNLEKLDSVGWKRLNKNLARQDWSEVTEMSLSELQEKIVRNLELAVKGTAELEKKSGDKVKLPYIVKKFLGAKKKASRKLRRKENLTTQQTKKLLEKIYRAETAIKNYYTEKHEKVEQEA